MGSTGLADALHLNYGDEGVLRVVYQESTSLQSWVLIWGITIYFSFLGLKMFLFLHFIMEFSVPSLPTSFLERQEK